MRTADPRAAADGGRDSGGHRPRADRRSRSPAWSRWAWSAGTATAVAGTWLLARVAAPEVAGLAALTDFAGRDNVFLGVLAGLGAALAAYLARGGRAAVRRRRQLVAIALGLLAICSLLFGARGLILMLLLEVALAGSFPREGPC